MKQLLSLVILFTITIIPSYSQELPIQDTSKVVKVKPKTLEAYKGHFEMEGMNLKVEFTLEGDQLFANVAGMGKIALKPGSNTAFQAKTIQAQIEFFDIKKQAQKLRLYQGGSVLIGNRIAAPVELDYETLSVGNPKIDYSKNVEPVSVEWDLIIGERKVGSATTHIRHAIFNGEPVYHGGSIIRYESMGNKPFADEGIFSKKDHRLLWARNAVSQTEEITSVVTGNEMQRITIDINSGEILDKNTVTLSEPINGSGIQSLLALDLEEGLTVQFPIMGIEAVSWAKIHVVGKEEVKIEALNKTFNAWKIEYSSGTIRWIVDEAPYLIKWKMPTGMEWELKSFNH